MKYLLKRVYRNIYNEKNTRVLSFLLALSSVDRQQIIKALILYVSKTNILLNSILVVISKKNSFL